MLMDIFSYSIENPFRIDWSSSSRIFQFLCIVISKTMTIRCSRVFQLPNNRLFRTYFSMLFFEITFTFMSTVRSHIVIECQLQIRAGRNERDFCATLCPASIQETHLPFLLWPIPKACVSHLNTTIDKAKHKENESSSINSLLGQITVVRSIGHRSYLLAPSCGKETGTLNLSQKHFFVGTFLKKKLMQGNDDSTRRRHT